MSSDTRTEWGVRRTWGDVGSVAGPMWRTEAEYAARTWPGELVKREVVYGEWETGLAGEGETEAAAAAEMEATG